MQEDPGAKELKKHLLCSAVCERHILQITARVYKYEGDTAPQSWQSKKKITAISLGKRVHEHAKYMSSCPLSEMHTQSCIGGSSNNIILPFNVARVIDEDEETLNRGGLHQPLLIPAACIKYQCTDHCWSHQSHVGDVGTLGNRKLLG